MAKRTITLCVDVEYDTRHADAESIATSLDVLMETARSTPGILDTCGNPYIGDFYVAQYPQPHPPDGTAGGTTRAP